MASYRGDFDKIEVLMDSGPELAFAWGLGFRDIFWLGEVVFCRFGLMCILKHQNVSDCRGPHCLLHEYTIGGLLLVPWQYFSWSFGKGKATLGLRYKKWISAGQIAWSRWRESWGWESQVYPGKGGTQEQQRIDAFVLWCRRRLLRVPQTERRSNQSILKEISSNYSVEGLMLKLKLQYSGHLMRRADSLEKTLILGKIEGRRRRGQ